MLDAFLEVAYSNDQKKQQAVKLASSLKNLPNDQLFALATGKAKLAFHHDEDWLEKYRGTPLFQEAMALEKADLENEVARTQASAAQPQMDQFWKTQDQIRIQKKMLDLKLVESEESGGMGLQDGGKLPEVVPATAQGAGALGDMPSEGAQQGEVGMQGAKVAGKMRDFYHGFSDMHDSLRSASKSSYERARRAGLAGRLGAFTAESGGDAAALGAAGAGGVAVGLHRGRKENSKKDREKEAQQGEVGMQGAKVASKKEEPTSWKDLASLPLGGAAMGAGIYGLSGLGRKGALPLTDRLVRGAGTGGAIGLGAAGLIGIGKMLQKADPSGRTLETAVRLAPAAMMAAGSIADSKKDREKKAQARFEKAALSGASIGGLVGSGLGAIGGAMTGGSKDVVGPDGQVHKTESHRLRNALIGAGLGGVTGAGIGHGVGKLRGAGEGLAKAEQAVGQAAAPASVAEVASAAPSVPAGMTSVPRPQVQVQSDPFPSLDLSRTGIPQKDLSQAGFGQAQAVAEQAQKPGIMERIKRVINPTQALIQEGMAKKAYARLLQDMQKTALSMGVLDPYEADPEHQFIQAANSLKLAAVVPGAINWKALGDKAFEAVKKNPKATGAVVGGIGGAIAGGPDNRLGGAALGAGIGAGTGAVTSGIGSRMARGQTFGTAASNYATNLKRRAQVGLGKAQAWVPRHPGEAAAAAPAATQLGLPGIA